MKECVPFYFLWLMWVIGIMVGVGFGINIGKKIKK